MAKKLKSKSKGAFCLYHQKFENEGCSRIKPVKTIAGLIVRLESEIRRLKILSKFAPPAEQESKRLIISTLSARLENAKKD